MMTRPRPALAIALACTTVALAVFTVSHFHGLSDPQTPHSHLDGLLFAQGQFGFLIALPLSIALGLAIEERVRAHTYQARPHLSPRTCFTRAPPLLPQASIEN
jgi:hypothetical protein